MIALTSLLVFLTVLILECARRRRQHWQYFAKRGIRGPPPHFLWGHYHLLRSNHRYWYARWAKEYGDTYGVFWGQRPLLVTSDLDLQQRVLVKEFSNFVNRAPLFATERIHPINMVMLMNEEGTRWKDLRTVISPAFSSGRIKALTDVIQKGVDEFGRNISKQKNNRFDLYPLLRRLTMDSILRTAFGIEANTQSVTTGKVPIVVAATEFLDFTFGSSLDLLMNSFELFDYLFGKALHYLFKFNILRHGSDKLNAETKRIVAYRRTAPTRKDIMQILLDSNTVSSDVSALGASGGSDENPQAADSATWRKRIIKLSDDDVIANSVLMLLAGYETTSTGLAYTFHLLAKHPEIQDKLRREIVETISGSEDQEALYTKTMNLKYLDLCLRESLRLCPPVTGFTTRKATEEIDHNGLKIEAGLSIAFPTQVIHNDPRNFESPLSFIPERFEDKPNHSLAYQAFGDGPRNCVGMRMALLTMKLTVCHVLRHYKLLTDEEIEHVSKGLVSQPAKVMVTAEATG